MPLTIEYVDKNTLKPYENNAKIHTDEQIQQIINSITQFGFNDPIAVWKDNEIIECHGRLLAALQMPSVGDVPIIRLDSLTDEQRKAYILAHNKLTMNTDFDFDILSKELDSITELDMSDFGFDEMTDIDWESVDDLTEKSYDRPEKAMLECPFCHKKDVKIHFKEVT